MSQKPILNMNTAADAQTGPSNGTPMKPSLLRTVFFGADGLRAGWGLVIFFALLAATFSGMNAVLHYTAYQPPPKDAPWSVGRIFLQGPAIFMTSLATWVMSKIEKRPMPVYGIGRRRALPHFLSGLTSGAACIAALVFALWKSRLLSFDGRLMSGAPVIEYGAIWIVGFLLLAVFQEYSSRGYLLFTAARGLAGVYGWLFKTRHSNALGFWTASILTSVLFALGHSGIPGESPIGLLCAGLAGMVFCLSLWRSGSLWWAIGFHTSWDWAQSFVFGVADSGTMFEHHLLATHPLGNPLMSGGATGPEGSLFALPILAVIVLIIIFTFPRAHAVYARQDQPGGFSEMASTTDGSPASS
jgi:membrane protease YdiL (CAAX protease family)